MKYIVITEIRNIDGYSKENDHVTVGEVLMSIQGVDYRVIDRETRENKNLEYVHFVLEAEKCITIEAHEFIESITDLYADEYITMDTSGRLIVDTTKRRKAYDKALEYNPYFRDSDDQVWVAGDADGDHAIHISDWLGRDKPRDKPQIISFDLLSDGTIGVRALAKSPYTEPVDESDTPRDEYSESIYVGELINQWVMNYRRREDSTPEELQEVLARFNNDNNNSATTNDRINNLVNELKEVIKTSNSKTKRYYADTAMCEGSVHTKSQLELKGINGVSISTSGVSKSTTYQRLLDILNREKHNKATEDDNSNVDTKTPLMFKSPELEKYMDKLIATIADNKGYRWRVVREPKYQSIVDGIPEPLVQEIFYNREYKLDTVRANRQLEILETIKEEVAEELSKLDDRPFEDEEANMVDALFEYIDNAIHIIKCRLEQFDKKVEK